ncbi:MAG: hypothetical protein ACREPY_07505 [Rhodanobacteraceae bacterium]
MLFAVIPAKAEIHMCFRLRSQVRVQIVPVWIGVFDELQLPNPFPFLDCLFTQNRGFHGFVLLEPCKAVYTIPLRKSFDQIVLVFPYALDEIGRYADVKGAAFFAGEYVDAWSSLKYFCPSSFRRKPESILFPLIGSKARWIPACAGMTNKIWIPGQRTSMCCPG